MIIKLTQCKSAHEPLQLVHLTDSHLMSDESKTFAGISPIASLNAVLTHLQAHYRLDDIDGLINTGDIAQDSIVSTYQHYLSALAPLNKPHFWIRGNHDDLKDFPKPDAKDAPIVIVADKWCIILLNSQADDCIYGVLQPEHLQKLQEYLIQYQDHHVLIAFHHHTFPVGSAWLDQHILQNSKGFLDCIAPYPNVKLVLSGHVHQQFEHKHHGVTFLSSPSSFVQFKPKSHDFSLDDLHGGYRMLYLYPNGEFKTQIHYLTESIGTIDKSITQY